MVFSGQHSRWRGCGDCLELLLKFWVVQGGRYSLAWLLAALTARLSKHDAKA